MVVSFTALQPFSAYIKSWKKVLSICKNQLIHTLLYRTIYHCIVIQKWQYIDTQIVYHYTSSCCRYKLST